MLKFEDITPDIIKKLWSKIKKGNPNECWPYEGYLNKDGYGRISIKINGKCTNIGAHCAAWMIENMQDIPDGMVIMHLCNNPSCCNSKEHLQLGTPKKNSEYMVKTGRASKYWLGKKISEQTKEILRKKNTGKKHSLETIEKCRIASASRKHTPETIQKMKIIHSGKIFSEEHRLNIGKARKGKKHSLEHKLKIGRASLGNKYCLGHKLSEEHKQKIIKANTGKTRTEETKLRLSAARKKWWADKRQAAAKAYHARKKLEKLIPELIICYYLPYSLNLLLCDENILFLPLEYQQPKVFY